MESRENINNSYNFPPLYNNTNANSPQDSSNNTVTQTAINAITTPNPVANPFTLKFVKRISPNETEELGTYIVDQSILINASPYFKLMIEGDFQEAEDSAIDLEIEPRFFKEIFFNRDFQFDDKNVEDVLEILHWALCYEMTETITKLKAFLTEYFKKMDFSENKELLEGIYSQINQGGLSDLQEKFEERYAYVLRDAIQASNTDLLKKLEAFPIKCLKLDFFKIKDISCLQNMLSLESLSIYCSKLTDNEMAHLKNLTNLKDLKLWDCTKLTDNGIAHLKGLINLKSLRLASYSKLGVNGIATLKDLTHLESLTLSDCKNLTDDKISLDGNSVFKNLTHLHSLSLAGCSSLKNPTFKGLNIKHLDLSYCQNLADESIASLKDVITLESLKLERCRNLKKPNFKELCLTNIHHLDLNDCENVTDEAIASVTSLTNLQSLNLNFTKVSDTGLANFKNLINLRSLNLNCCKNLTDNGIANLAHLFNLRSLTIIHCDNLTDEGIAYLKNLTNLESLDLCENNLTAEGIAYIKNLINLVSLNLNNCQKLTDEGISHLTTLTNLVSLDLSNCQELTDEGISYLKTLTNLESLNLSYCKITKKGLKHLIHLSNLRILDLHQCPNLTKKDVKFFERQMPNVKIVY